MTKRINATIRIRDIDEDTFFDLLELIKVEAPKTNHETFETQETRTHVISRDTGKPAAPQPGRNPQADVASMEGPSTGRRTHAKGIQPLFAPGA